MLCYSSVTGAITIMPAVLSVLDHLISDLHGIEERFAPATKRIIFNVKSQDPDSLTLSIRSMNNTFYVFTGESQIQAMNWCSNTACILPYLYKRTLLNTGPCNACQGDLSAKARISPRHISGIYKV